MLNEVRKAKAQYADHLMAMQNVVMVGVGEKVINGAATSELAVVVGVTKKVSCAQLPPTQQIPATMGGVRTDVIQVGKIKALQVNRKGKVRPAPGGVSIGHPAVTAGTLGCVVYRDGESLILSNNHVLADSGQAARDDPILQPGAYDGGTAPEDVLAELDSWVEIDFDVELPDCPYARSVAKICDRLAIPFGHRFGAVRQSAAANLVDCAVARPLSPDLVDPAVLDIGIPLGIVGGELGMAVRKSGRTTGLTEGVLTQIDLTVQVLYGTAIATFEGQLAGDLVSDGGDSGSVVFGEGNLVAGLLFAGGEGVTIFNPALAVADALGVSFTL